MEPKKAFGLVTALGTKLGERARDEPDLLSDVRATPDADAFRDLVRRKTEGLVPPTLVDAFTREVVADADWQQWRSRLLLQAKMVRDGGKPMPGHEKGRGVGKP